MLFSELRLIEPILKAVESEGYQKPTPIQEKAIPSILKLKDLLGCAQTGTGKRPHLLSQCCRFYT